MFNRVILVINLALIIGLGIYVLIHFSNEKKQGFVLNQRLFDEYQGTKKLQGQLEALQERHKLILDSLSRVVQASGSKIQFITLYDEESQKLSLERETLSQKYTADIWKHINNGISDYAKSNGYDFVYGASGNGNLMYASDKRDITNDVIKYLNEK